MILRNSLNKFSGLKYENGKYELLHVERIDPRVLKDNYELRKDKKSCWSADKELRLIASVPTLTYIQWMKQYPELRDSDAKYRDNFLKKLLDKEENRIFKTVENI